MEGVFRFDAIQELLAFLGLIEIPNQLYELSALKRLSLRSNSLVALPAKFFTSLAKLEALDKRVA